MKIENYPRPSLDPKPKPISYSEDVVWGGFLMALSLLAAVGAGLGCLTDELAPTGGRIVAVRLFSLVGGWAVDEVQGTALVSFAIFVGSLVRLVGSVGLACGRRWGFMISGTISTFFALGGMGAFPNVFGISGAIYGTLTVIYCVRRIRGQKVLFLA